MAKPTVCGYLLNYFLFVACLIRHIVIFRPHQIMKYSALTQAIRATGLSVNEFVTQRLGTSYSNYHYRLSNGVLTIDQLHKICFYTGRSFDELFPNPYIKAPVRIPLNLSSGSPAPTTAPAPVKRIQESALPRSEPQGAPAKSQAPAEEPKKKEDSKESSSSAKPAAPSLDFDIFDGGFPPSDTRVNNYGDIPKDVYKAHGV